MHIAPQLVLFSTDATQVAQLRNRFCNEAHILVEQGNGIEVSLRCKLNAMWMTPMMAHDSGIAHLLPPHVASIFPMPRFKKEKGLPSLLITGVTLVHGEQYTARYLSRAAADALAKAVADYNRSHDQPIVRIGAVPGTLGLDDLNNTESFDAIIQAFSDPAGSSHPRDLDRNLAPVLASAPNHR